MGKGALIILDEVKKISKSLQQPNVTIDTSRTIKIKGKELKKLWGFIDIINQNLNFFSCIIFVFLPFYSFRNINN